MKSYWFALVVAINDEDFEVIWHAFFSTALRPKSTMTKTDVKYHPRARTIVNRYKDKSRREIPCGHPCNSSERDYCGDFSLKSVCGPSGPWAR